MREGGKRERDACNVFTLGISVNGSCKAKEKEQSGGHDSSYTWHASPSSFLLKVKVKVGCGGEKKSVERGQRLLPRTDIAA